ncbi:MAG TPA: MFS transporter [Thermomicrobiales bacterium]|nr:MFS transporter [Thermomicrobiales bacterium]
MTSHTRGRVAVAAFLVGNGVSLIGNVMALVALPWFVLQTTGSASQTGLTGMAAALPAFMSGVLGGILVDRLGGRRMSVISDVVSGLAVVAIPLLHATVGLAFWQLLVLVFAGAFLDIPGLTARRLLLPELSASSGLRPEAMNSSFEVMQGASAIVGPALAGLLIGPLGAVNLLWITAATFVVSALLIGIFAPEGKAHHEPAASPGPIVKEIFAGLGYLRRDRLLFVLAISLTITNFLSGAFGSVAIPVAIQDRFGSASKFGLLLTAMGVGTLVGGMAYGTFGHRLRSKRRLIWLVGFASESILMWAFVAQASYPALIAAAVLVGLLVGPVNPMLVTIRFERIPVALRGRVFATFSALAGAAAPIGMVGMGWVLDTFGIQEGLVAIATLGTVIGIGAIFVPVLREMDRPPVSSPEVQARETVART